MRKTDQEILNEISESLKENLKSFVGYPLIYNRNAVGVLAMFSEKKLNLADFEILGIFCNRSEERRVGKECRL